MPLLGLLTGNERDNLGDTPQLPLRNLYVTGSRTEPGGVKLVGRPALKYVSATELNANGTTGVYKQDGVLSGYRTLIFGTDVSFPSDDTTISGNLVPSVAGNAIGAIVTNGGNVKFDDGSTVRTVTTPDNFNCRKVLESEGRFVFLRRGSHRYYWTEPLANMLDGSGDIEIDGLSYASAEYEPDELYDGLFYKGILVLFGSETVEMHSPSGNENSPWTPILGSAIDRGILQTGCATLWNNSFAWIGQDYSVYRYTGSGKEKISTPGVERLLRAAGTAANLPRLDRFNFEGREFLRVWVDADTPDQILDADTGEWCEWATDDAQFLGGPSLEFDDYTVFYSKTIGKQLHLSRVKSFVAGTPESTIKYLFHAGLPIDGGQVTMHNVLLRCQTDLSGDTIALRTSNDKGDSWTSQGSVTLDGPRVKVEWRSLGMFDQQGFLAEFSCTQTTPSVAPTEFAVSGAYFNEFVMGRSR